MHQYIEMDSCVLGSGDRARGRNNRGTQIRLGVAVGVRKAKTPDQA